jgi:tetratricopeptide (TPR) repeat protein
LPTSFLLDQEGLIVKIYQGAIDPSHVAEDLRNIPTTTAQRLAKALPFPVVTDAAEFRRNYLSLGSIFFQRGYYEQSDGFFRAALKDDPNSAEAHYGLGSACLKLQRNKEALGSFQRATQLPAAYPDTLANAWNNLGLLATEEGKTAEAIPSFQEALRENPNHFIAMVNLGNAYRQQRQWPEARETLTQALTIRPEDPEGNYAMGMVFAETDDTARAFNYLQKALKARPAYPEALNNLGVLYLRTRRRDEAVASFEECIRVAPAFDQSYLNLARVYALEGDSAKARLVLLDLLKQRPNDAQAQRTLEQLPNR